VNEAEESNFEVMAVVLTEGPAGELIEELVLGIPRYGFEVVRQRSAKSRHKRLASVLYLSAEQGYERTGTGAMVEWLVQMP
jgi:hypothetical protein